MPLAHSGQVVGRRRIFRHPAYVRLTHWINVVCLTGLLMSGLQIFNAHPHLYWGKDSHFDTPMVSVATDAEGTKGVTTVFGHEFDTTGWLGYTAGPQGNFVDRAFPHWITLPGPHDLATGRRWHFFFAWVFVLNGLTYLLLALFGGHVWRDLLPSREQLRNIGRSIVDHLLLRFPRGDEARQYNVLQKLSYLIVIFVFLPVMVLAGLTMSPALNAAFPWLADLFGGRQAARTVHFALAIVLVGFVLVHVAMVLLTGVWNNLRSMITGRYDIEEETHENAPTS